MEIYFKVLSRRSKGQKGVACSLYSPCDAGLQQLFFADFICNLSMFSAIWTFNIFKPVTSVTFDHFFLMFNPCCIFPLPTVTPTLIPWPRLEFVTPGFWALRLLSPIPPGISRGHSSPERLPVLMPWYAMRLQRSDGLCMKLGVF